MTLIQNLSTCLEGECNSLVVTKYISLKFSHIIYIICESLSPQLYGLFSRCC
jgi:hypothetical protein